MDADHLPLLYMNYCNAVMYARALKNKSDAQMKMYVEAVERKDGFEKKHLANMTEGEKKAYYDGAVQWTEDSLCQNMPAAEIIMFQMMKVVRLLTDEVEQLQKVNQQ